MDEIIRLNQDMKQLYPVWGCHGFLLILIQLFSFSFFPFQMEFHEKQCVFIIWQILK